ncbi:hypothetical protein [Pectobacterium carotovorum]|nr:hypothetical protein [Pectobacterium carotovorum]GKW38889.1 hypothetical protein PEC301875_29130 [Pectobacterium carotovorum subsp. carotovorum]
MTDKTGLLVVPRFLMRLWGWCALNLLVRFLSLLFFSGNRIRREGHQ